MKMVTIVFLLFVLFLTVIYTAEEKNDNHVIEFNKFKVRRMHINFVLFLFVFYYIL